MIENKVLNLYPIDYPFETLVQRTNSDPPKLILNPDFQRKYKWDKDGFERASRFIESCLMRIPLPACYFAENEKGNHEVIDGVQRITAIKRFFNNEYKLEGLTVFEELEGKTFDELGDLRNELESTTIRCIILRKENPKELIQEIFARLNQGAVQLTAQEIRHAIYPGSLDDLLVELAQHPYIEKFGKGEAGTKEKDGREAEEMVLRFFSMQTDLDDYEDVLSKYLDRYASKNQNLEPELIAGLKVEFIKTLEKCLYVFDGRPFIDITKERPKQSLVHYDLLMWSFRNLTDEFINKYKDDIARNFNELCEDGRFIRTLSGGLQKKSALIRRREVWMEKLGAIEK